MKATRIFLCLLVVAFLIGVVGMDAWAATTIEIDNDALSTSGYTNSGSSSVFQYKTGSTLYNGDARIAPCTIPGEDKLYHYNYNHVPIPYTKSSLSVTFGMYLYHNDFTDPQAIYFVNASSSIGRGGIASCGINQNTAAAGWNYISTVRYNLTGTHMLGGVSVCPSGYNTRTYTGADAIKITYVL